MAIDFNQIENTIGYEFNNSDLLQQAFVRRSYSEENGGQNNEVLEFIGDKALDLAVIRLMMDRFGVITDNKDFKEIKLRNPKYFKTKLNEGQFTDIKKDLVQKKYLAKCIKDLGFEQQLIMGVGDTLNNIQDQDSVKEDLFEAIIGAVTFDCDWDMYKITDVVDNMLDMDSYFEHEEQDNYVGLLQEWSQKHGYGLPNYEYEERYDSFHCYVTVGDQIVESEGGDSSRAKARADAAYNAYEELLENGYILNEYEEAVGEPDYDESLRQIHELVQKKMILNPEYNFEGFYDDYGNPYWECSCGEFEGTGSNKKEAQREVAYQMLCSLMDYAEE